jgi:hypothetical protein
VPGSEAAEYHFTSALAVQLLKALAPQLEPLIDAPPMSRIDDPLPRAYVVQTLPRPENSERGQEDFGAMMDHDNRRPWS